MNSVQNIRELIQRGEYESALELCISASEDGAPDSDILTAKLRSACIDLAYRKADYSPDYFALEKLLTKANELTGEDMYGRRR